MYTQAAVKTGTYDNSYKGLDVSVPGYETIHIKTQCKKVKIQIEEILRKIGKSRIY